MESGQPVEYRKRVLDSDDEEEIRDLPEEEQRLARRTKVQRWYVPSQTVVKRPVTLEESNVAMCAWLGVHAGVAKVTGVKGRRDADSGKGTAAVKRLVPNS